MECWTAAAVPDFVCFCDHGNGHRIYYEDGDQMVRP